MSTDAKTGNKPSMTDIQSKRYRAALLGASLEVGNRGVRALAVAAVTLIDTAFAGARISLHYWSSAGGPQTLIGSSGPVRVEICNCRQSLQSRASEHIGVILISAFLYRFGVRGPAERNVWLRNILAADFVGDIRGGDSFSDVYGLRRFLAGCLPLLSVAIIDSHYWLLPQTYGPFRSPLARVVARFFIRRATVVLTRDNTSADFVRRLCGRIPLYCPDVAFILPRKRPADLRMVPFSINLADEPFIIGLNVSGLLYMGGYTRNNQFGLFDDYRTLIRSLVEALLHSTNAKLLLIPHTFGSENEEQACAAVLKEISQCYEGRVALISEPLDEQELKWVIGKTDIFIGSRMHACIAALSQHVPSVGLAYSDKFLGVFESAGLGDTVVDLRHMSVSQVVHITMSIVSRRWELAKRLQDKIPSVQAQVFEIFSTVHAEPAHGIPIATSGALS